MANESGSNRPNRPMRPRQGGPGARRKRRVVIDNAAARPRDARQQQREREAARPKQPREVAPVTGPVSVESGLTVRDLSQALGVPAPKIIMFMMGLGKAVTITQSLGDDEVELIAAEFAPDRELTIRHAADEEEAPEVFEDAEADLAPRPPVVTIMGHVDHGKTTLLDAIRETSVVETEAGGITQHIGAYQVHHDERSITFLDTPGHEAFTAMRARGAKVTDIAVLVVAADDGVMPQTKESISHARAAEVPIVVAVNKIDVANAKVDRGNAELDLRANAGAEASGFVIESRLDVGRGPVSTVLVLRGTLKVGDAVVAGDASGRVRALYDYRGERVQEAKPGDPVEVLGFEHPPIAGEFARVVEHERQAKHLANVRAERLRREQLAQRPRRRVSLETLFEGVQAGEVRDLNIVLKGDVQGSLEAIVSELQKIQHPEVAVNVIHTGVGGITENDVNLASASDALVIGFNVRPSADARQLAEREGVDIRTYRVIYQLTEDIQQALVGMLSPVQTEETLGEAEVRALFKVSRLGTIAGSMVTSGVVRRGARVRIIRDGTVIHETSIAQLKRFKDDVREVAEGFECGILLDGFNDVKEGDVLEVYETREVERTDLTSDGD